VSGLDRLGGWP